MDFGICLALKPNNDRAVFRLSTDDHLVTLSESSHSCNFEQLLLQKLHCKLYPDFTSTLPNPEIKTVRLLFLTSPALPCIEVLAEEICTTRNSLDRNFCTALLEQRLTSSDVGGIIYDRCRLVQRDIPSSEIRLEMERLTVLLCTLPDRVANAAKFELREAFLPDNYISTMVEAVIVALEQCHGGLQCQIDVDLKFIGLLIGKLNLQGYGVPLWRKLMPFLSAKVEDGFLWRRLTNTLFLHIPDQCLEGTLTAVLLESPWYQTVLHLLGDVVKMKSKAEFLMCNKFITVKVFQQNKFLHNLIGYLSSLQSRAFFQKMFKSSINIWSDGSALKHESFEQHLYITKAVLISSIFCKDDDLPPLRQSCSTVFMHGVQCHLDASSDKIRQLGMFTAERLSTLFYPELNHQLDFKLEESSDLVADLKSIMFIPSAPKSNPCDQVSTPVNGAIQAVKEDIVTTTKSTNMEELDSDDDLEPYDLSNDVKFTKVKPPVFIRDCMQGLLAKDDPDTNEICLQEAERLIRKHMTTSQEVALEFSKLLLHLQNILELDNFHELKQKALVALVITQPAQVSEFLASEFFERNYNIRQRLDILEVLMTSAKELTSPQCKTPDVTQAPAKKSTTVESQQKSWRVVVQERIDAKTKRYAKAPRKPQVRGSPNRFALVAGYFFFPLLKNFDRKENTFDMLGEDHILLSQFLRTLGVVVHAAQNTLIVVSMVKSLLDLLFALKYHPQVGVRQALLFAMIMAILSTPAHIFFSDLQADVADIKNWFEDIMEKDSDKECQQMAAQGLAVLIKTLQTELPVD